MNPFTDHPHGMGETYWTHLGHSIVFSSRMLMACIICLIHGILPFVFVFTTSEMLVKMTRAFVKRSPKDERFEGLRDL